MRFINLLFLLISTIAFGQEGTVLIVCFGSTRDIPKVERITELPWKEEYSDLDSLQQVSLAKAKQKELIISFPHSHAIYTGYDNLIKVALQGKNFEKIQLTCEECDTLYQKHSGQNSAWIVRANTPGKIEINAVRKNKVISSKEIDVFAVPLPTVYLDDLDAQLTLTTLPNQIGIKLDENIPLSIQFVAVRWDILINNEKQFSGSGHSMTQKVQDYLQKVNKGTMQIDLSYFSPEGEQKIREIFRFHLK
ncbi:MAG: hypothetical protein AB8B56_10580 [Crocinitomicaceae bacterium]